MTQQHPTAYPRRRRRFPWSLLVLAFLAVPLVEIYVIIQVGQVIGPWWTILLLIADSALGSWLIKREGSRAWAALRTALESGRMPSQELADGALILVGGTLMLSPGFVLDVLGLLFILPFTRPVGRRLLAGFISRRLARGVVGGVGFGPGSPFGPGFGSGSGSPFTTGFGGTARRPGADADDPVVRGEVLDDPPDDRS